MMVEDEDRPCTGNRGRKKRGRLGKRACFAAAVKCIKVVRHLPHTSHEPAMPRCHLWDHPPVWLLRAFDVGKKGGELTLVLLVIALSPRALWRAGAVLTWPLRAA